MTNKFECRFLTFILLMLSVQCPTFRLYAQEVSQKKPNVILIMADDMGIGDLSAFNDGMSRTPHLDKLLETGVWFSQAYSASCVCTPARAALLTGRYPHRTGAVTLNMELYPTLNRIHLGIPTIADIFSENGYVTGLIGKWHTGDGPAYHPLKRGFQEFVGFKGYDVPSYFNFKLDVQGVYQQMEDQYLTDVLTAYALDFVQKYKQQPFFLNLAYFAPHRPLDAPQKTINYYLDKGYNSNIETIYAMIEVMDQGIGKLMNALDQLGIRESTIVFFVSDNGSDPLTGERFNIKIKGEKYTVYEGGIRVLFIVQWKDRLQASVRNEMVHFTDILPTLMEICHLDTPEQLPLDGRSMSGVLFGKEEETASIPRFWQWNRGTPYYSHNAAMREGEWKLVRPFVTRNLPESESIEKPVLYNLKEDPYETQDVSKSHPDIYNKMCVLLEEWSRQVELDRIRSARH
ncbi:sulfatase-like hydrolase/transferase [Catalinimonas niigatensis]|uniref:sulfatase-like hydrolase/transferase n=1 Tax=Catalinimonas niigatensis TaxID=1397264 RepID=UPI002665EA9F|nr:sulfatase-like hydrolase/transferase [Catalinimonas niigatensis]WPP51887.1 sulfatase-like hydrolase/transferase [Catalinimonas niigatensis]